MEPENTRKGVIASDARSRWIFVVLAVVVPLGLFATFRRQELRLEALAERGQATTAIVARVTRQNGSTFTHYRYEVGGRDHEWSVAHDEAPYAPGTSFPVTYSPDDPSLSRPVATYTRAALDAERNPALRWGLPGGLFVLFALIAFAADRNVRRLRAGAPLRTGPRLSPDAAGRAVAALLLAALLAVNFAEDVAATQAAAFGARPLGVPVAAVVSLSELVLFAPFFWVFPHLMRIVMDAQASGGGFTRGGIALAVMRADGPLRRSRMIVLAGLAWFVTIVAAWIALAASRGV